MAYYQPDEQVGLLDAAGHTVHDVHERTAAAHRAEVNHPIAIPAVSTGATSPM